MTGAGDEALLEEARLQGGDDVLVLGGGPLVFGAHERIGDGWVYVVRSQVDELEGLLQEAHGNGAAGVAYLVGEAPVLPLPDGAVTAVVGRVAVDAAALATVAGELLRVLRPGGRVALGEPDAGDAEVLRSALAAAGFVDAAATGDAGGALVTARCP